MQDSPKVLSVQDISCFGQCSNTVMLPILSCAGCEVVPLPTALLSTHTGGFQGFTFLDLSAEMEKILSHFQAQSLRFSYLTTGYFADAAQIDLLTAALPDLLLPDALRLVDPVMGDHGSLYSIYDIAYVDSMRRMCRGADIITPNMTEAALLAKMPYKGNEWCEADAPALFDALHALGVPRVVLTGVMFPDGSIGAVGHAVGEAMFTATAPYVDRRFHGTGDTFAAALLAHIANGIPWKEAVTGAVSFVSHCISDTLPCMDSHWYGLRFEGRLFEITRLHQK